MTEPVLASGAPTEHFNQRVGREFLFAFHGALRALRLYPLENQTVQRALHDLEQLGRQIGSGEGSVALGFVGNFCFVNDVRLRIDLASHGTFSAVSRALAAHGVGQVEAWPGAEVREWAALLSHLLAEPPAEGNRFETLQRRLESSMVRYVQVAPTADAPPAQVISDQARQAAKQTYSQSVSVARDAMLGARMGKGVSLRRVKRAVQQIVDQVLNNESSMLGMTVLRDYDQYTFAHSVNVCIFSIAVGKKLGLSKKQLYELGLGALMHDIGKVALPIELTNKNGPLQEAEWAVVREHPTEGLLALLEMPGLGELPLRAMLLAYEHHMKRDLSGYPRCVRPRAPTLFSRIVSIADGFDAATSRRSYQNAPALPDQVLRGMLENQNHGLDPLLVKAFISMTGIYPVGSVVILDSFELGVVVAPSTQPEHYHQPVIRLIYDEMGIPLSTPQTVDLTETDPETGRPLRTIIKTTDPETYGINVRDYFV